VTEHFVEMKGNYLVIVESGEFVTETPIGASEFGNPITQFLNYEITESL
jgi:hypothetical protein